jgi:hypothetical protein
MSILRRVAWFVIVLVCSASLLRAEPSSVNLRLKTIKRLHVGNTGVKEEGGEEVRKKLIARTASSGRFTYVDSLDHADADVLGSAGYKTSYKNGQRFVTGYATLTLLDLKTQEHIWAFEYKKGQSGAKKASDRVADQFLEKLLADAKAAASSGD